VSKVTEIPGEAFRFHVQSDSDPSLQYLVDLEMNDAIGWCGCPHWAYRLGPKVAKGERIRCRHLKIARDYAFDGLIRRLIFEMEKAKSRR